MGFMSRRRRRDEGAELEMASMIDIIFLLLIFFISVTKFKTLETKLKVAVPAMEKATKQESRPPVQEIVIEVRPNTILVNGTTWTLDQLQAKLKLMAEIDKDQPIIILGHKDALHEEIVNVINSCSRADLLNVSLAIPD